MTAIADSTRGRLLAAGRELLAEADAELLLNGLTVGDVATRAGLSTQTFHNAYPSRAGIRGGKKAYLDELMSSLLPDHSEQLRAGMGAAIAGQLVEADGDPRPLVRAVCRREYQRLSEDPATRLRFLLCALSSGRNGAISDARAYYAGTERIATEANARLLQGWGAGLRQPFTHASLSVVLTALVEGLVLRSRLDPDAVSPELFGEAVLALLGSIADLGQAFEQIDDVLTPLVEAARRSRGRGELDELPDDPVQALIEAAEAEFAQRGYFATGPGHIAARAGVAVDVLQRLFPSNADIVTAALSPTAAQLKRRIDGDVKLHLGPAEIVRRAGHRLAAAVSGQQSMFDALILIISLDPTRSPAQHTGVRDELFLPGMIVDVVQSGQAAGVFVDDLEPAEIAVAYTNNILLRRSVRREETVEVAMEYIEKLVLRGLLVEPRPT
ncbi:TetR/AcrR family transcriptional regulator [Skermania piniformis]|uniref:TetR/AcrR family transcriptional regulator n=1 Tax=Skermania pinensis TaxID=39122 RepID=A0ABX8S966_9ACTN|nr:TetR/AcrR family transcriptional regulator [Skermania piniformis]QXQ14408.1 TetR/AcrR family transcriptional regulator [Skermania piniformis]